MVSWYVANILLLLLLLLLLLSLLLLLLTSEASWPFLSTNQLFFCCHFMCCIRTYLLSSDWLHRLSSSGLLWLLGLWRCAWGTGGGGVDLNNWLHTHTHTPTRLTKGNVGWCVLSIFCVHTVHFFIDYWLIVPTCTHTHTHIYIYIYI